MIDVAHFCGASDKIAIIRLVDSQASRDIIAAPSPKADRARNRSIGAEEEKNRIMHAQAAAAFEQDVK
jgi:hypothetical protein